MKPHTLAAALLAASCGFGASQATDPSDDTTDASTASSDGPGQTGPRWQALDDDDGGASGSASTTMAERSDSSTTAELADSSTAELADSSTAELGSSSETSSSSTDPEPETSSSSTDAETGSGSTTGPACACCYIDGDQGCELPDVEDCTCAWDDGVTNASYCCIGAWAMFCVDVAQQYCGLDCTGC